MLIEKIAKASALLQKDPALFWYKVRRKLARESAPAAASSYLLSRSLDEALTALSLKREQQAVVYVQAQFIALAFGPWNYVGSAQKSGIGDAGQRAAAVPVFH